MKLLLPALLGVLIFLCTSSCAENTISNYTAVKLPSGILPVLDPPTHNEIIMITTFNGAFLIICGIFVMVMQTGFAMLEVGSVQSADAVNILFKNMLDVCIGGFVWWAFGYALAFGTGSNPNGFIGNEGFFLYNFDLLKTPVWFFQFTFAATSCTIVSGAIAERARFQAYLIFAAVMVSFIYPVGAHWVWSKNGFLYAGPHGLFGTGVIDFAGCSVVHVCGGAASFWAAKLIGYRNQHSTDPQKHPPRFELVDGKWIVNELPSNSESLATMGVLLLWFGWYGFNCGSIGSIINLDTGRSNIHNVGRIAVNTTLSPSMASLTAILYGRYTSVNAKYNLGDGLNGILAGLVSVTAGCVVMEPWGAVLTGCMGGLIYKWTSIRVSNLRVDDPLDCTAVHGACGMWGLLACGLFAHRTPCFNLYGISNFGMFMGGGYQLFVANLVGGILIGLWSSFFTFLIFLAFVIWDKDREDTYFIIRSDKETLTFGAEGKKKASAFIMPSHIMIEQMAAAGGLGVDDGGLMQLGGPAASAVPLGGPGANVQDMPFILASGGPASSIQSDTLKDMSNFGKGSAAGSLSSDSSGSMSWNPPSRKKSTKKVDDSSDLSSLDMKKQKKEEVEKKADKKKDSKDKRSGKRSSSKKKSK